MINESLRVNDLMGLVRAKVLVDHYTSKIDEAATVITFMVSDRKAATDLNRFIQKSYIQLLDTDVSAAPDQDGFYFVFVEVCNNSTLGENVAALCGDVSAIADIRNWVVHLRGTDPSKAMPVSAIEKFITDNSQESVDDFFKKSEADSITVQESTWTFSRGAVSMKFGLVDFGELSSVLERNKLFAMPLDESSISIASSLAFARLLGDDWRVQKIDGMYAVMNEHSGAVALLQP